ncbi:Ank-2 multi-domain protein, partial [Pyrenophora tritici-repentis]
LLKVLKEGFLRTRVDIDIWSCFERVGTPTSQEVNGVVSRNGPPVLYVSESSSCVVHPRAKNIPVNFNHSEAAKLSATEGSPYHTIKLYLAQIVSNTRVVVSHRIGKRKLSEALREIAASLLRAMEALSDTDILIWAVKSEIDDIHEMLANIKVECVDRPIQRLIIAQYSSTVDLKEASHIVEEIRQLLSDTPGLSALLAYQNATKMQQDQAAFARSVQSFAEEIIPLLLNLKDTLVSSQINAKPSFLERFIGSDAAKQLGLSFVAQMRRCHEAGQDDLLEQSKGTIKVNHDRKNKDENNEEGKNGDGKNEGKKKHDEISDIIIVAKYQPIVGEGFKQVIIEYREYAHDVDADAIGTIKSKVQQLATQLKKLTSTSTEPAALRGALQPPLSVLPCIDWKHDTDNKRFVLIYDIPRQLQNRLQDKESLFSTLGVWNHHRITEKWAIPFEQLYYIAYRIAHTTFNLHIRGWICYQRDKSPQKNPTPYLKGFEFSRKYDTHSERLRSNDYENDMYRHPGRQGLPDEIETFKLYHDLYAVGTVLFELGRSRCVEDILPKQLKLNGKERVNEAWEVRNTLVKEAKTKMPKYAGTAFAKCVCAVFALLNAGADANVDSKWSKLVSLQKWLEIEPKSLAYPEGYFIALEKLIGSLDVQDEFGMSLPLLWISLNASGLDYLEGLTWLQKKGATITTRDTYGRDVLFYAANNREIWDEACLQIMELYLESLPGTSRAGILNESKHGVTARTAFMAMCYNCYIRSVEYAIENGIDVNDSGREGMTALDIALDSGNGMRLGLWTNFARERGRLPKRSDQIIDAIFHNDGFGDEFKQSESSDNNVYAAKSRYMTFQKISQRLIAADAQTGKQLQRRDRAPDIKQREKEVP